MKLTNEQFTEAAFIFEKANGNFLDDYEEKLIATSHLTKFNITELEMIIIDGLNSGIYEKEEERVSGYWSLSKLGNRNLIKEYKKWLRTELESKSEIAVFQILVGLDRLEESTFNKNRSGRAVDESELNFRDAEKYLSQE
ncbi:hypothetical protein [Croceiramulus getboli]|nr:hypothetical protein P8624_00080 [Flavobacteriaceae bacterium YJPT1-3]